MSDRQENVDGPTDVEAAWEETIADMEAMVTAREEAGWEAASAVADETTPLDRASGTTERYGLVFTLPDDRVPDFQDAFARGEFPRYEVYRSDLEGTVFLVVEYFDREADLVFTVAGRYDLADAVGMVHDAEADGEMYTHFRTHDDAYVGTFRHDGHEKFVPYADEIDDRVEG